MSRLALVKTHLGKLNFFQTGSHEEHTLQNERRSTRVYLILLTIAIVLLTFYYCITPTTKAIVVESPTFSQYSSLVQYSSLQCFCSLLAVKYQHFVQIEPNYHEVCRSDLVSDDWINRLFTLYEESRSDAILSDFYRVGVFQFRTLRALCQLAQETIAGDIRLFQESEFIQTLLIEEQLFHSQIDSIFTMFIDTIHTKFWRALSFMQDTAAQSMLFTGAAVTSLQPKYSSTLNVDGVGISYYGIQYAFADGSSCLCSSSTATTCMGLATFHNHTVVGFQTGCYMFSALLKSTLEAFDNQTFVDMLTESSDTFRKLNSSEANRTIEMLLTHMFVTRWSKTARFQQYYNRCAPDSCQYTLRERHDLLDILTLLLGLFGGLSSVLNVIVPVLTTIVWKIARGRCGMRPSHVVQNETTPSLSLHRHLKQLVELLKQKVIELNLFEHIPRSNDADKIRKQRRLTRVYLTMLFVIVVTLIVFTSMRPQIVTVTIPSPTMATFIQLSEQYPLTLDCPCSQAAISYSRLISYVRPKYHIVCSSDLVSSKWVNVRFIQTPGEKILTYDIRYQFPFHFQLLATLCHVARQTIDESLQSFYQTALITTRALSQEAFRNQTDVIIEQFQRTAPQSFQRTLEVIKTNLEINQFITSMNSEFRSFLRVGGTNTVPLVYALFRSFTNPECRRHESDLNPCGCFPLSYYTCYFPTIIQKNELRSAIPGTFQSWFPLHALLESTLECFYNDTCLSQITDLINSTVTPVNVTSLNVLRSSSSNEQNERIESLANRLFVQSWSHDSSFASYFDQCRPLTCQYTYTSRLNLIFIITSIVGLIGGVNIALRLLTPLIGDALARLWSCKRRRQPTMTSRRPTLADLLRSIFESFTRVAIELNLFAPIPASTDPKIIRRGRRTTRIYLLLLITALFVVVLYASFRQETITETISAPSLTTYNGLYKNYPSTLRCPCSRTAIKYGQFIVRMQPHYHEVCDSVFVSSQWMESLQDPTGSSTLLAGGDFRLTIRMQFQTLSKLCALSRNIINPSLITLLETDFVTSAVLSTTEFDVQTTSATEQFKRTTASQLVQTIKQMQVVNDGNQLATVASTNWQFLYKSRVTEQEKTYERILPVLARPKVYGEDNCSCGIRTDCSRLSEFSMRTSNQSLTQTLPGFQSGCLLFDAFLQSTLTCLYNRTCLDLMRAAIFYMKPALCEVLTRSSSSSSWSPNTTVRVLLNQLFVSHWDEQISFDLYYNACAPQLCRYSYTVQYNRAYILATLIALFGGLTKGLRFAMLFLTTITYKLTDRRTKKKNDVVPTQQATTIVNTSEDRCPASVVVQLGEENVGSQLRRKGILVLCALSILVAVAIATVGFIWFAGRKTESELVGTSTMITTMSSHPIGETTSTSLNSCSLTFENQPQGYPTGAGPRTLVTGDFNGDSLLDFAVTNSIDDTLSIILGNGDGTFQPQHIYRMESASRPWGITSADFNNDSVVDLAITLSGSRDVAVVFGVAGDLLFNNTPRIYSYYQKESVPGEIEVGDLDNNGFLDLVVCMLVDETSVGFSIYLNQGETVLFEEATLGFDYLVNDVISVTIGDFDNDERQNDLAGIDMNGEAITICSANYSSLNEFYETKIGMYAHPSSVINGRFNWDHLDDLAFISLQSDTLQILLAYGDRTFTQHIYLTDARPTSVARINFNNDSIDDLAVLSCSRTLTIFAGSELGLFHRIPIPLQIGNDTGEECARSLVAGDFNRDGKDDVAFIDAQTQQVQVLRRAHCDE